MPKRYGIFNYFMESEDIQDFIEENADVINDVFNIVTEFTDVIKDEVLNNITEFIGETSKETYENIAVFTEAAVATFTKLIADEVM